MQGWVQDMFHLFTRKVISCCGNRSNASLKWSLCRLVMCVVKFKMKGNRQFLSSKNSYFQNKTKCKIFLLKMSFICMGIEIYFYINGFALSLALKLRLEATWIWPIVMHSTNCSYACMAGLMRLLNSVSTSLGSSPCYCW